MRETTFACSSTMFATPLSAYLLCACRIRSAVISSYRPTRRHQCARRTLSRGQILEINRRTPKRARSSILYRSKVPGRRAFSSQGRIRVPARDRRIFPIRSSRSRADRSYRHSTDAKPFRERALSARDLAVTWYQSKTVLSFSTAPTREK